MALEDIQEILGNNPWSVRARGAAPPSPGGNVAALAAALRGDVIQPRLGGFQPGQAPRPVQLRQPVEQRAQSVGMPTGASMTSVSGATGGGRDLGGGAIAAGLGKLGAGIEGALGDVAEKQKAKQADLAAASAAGLNKPSAFGTPPSGGAPAPPKPFGAPPAAGPVLAPIGAASTLPIQAQAGGGSGAAGGSIGPAGSLPILAAGTGAQTERKESRVKSETRRRNVG
jgi:hypothetical protein